MRSRYLPRFFFLLDIFLASRLLPSYLVAAFAKRLAHLALTAPVPAVLTALATVRNLLLRHKAIRTLIQRTPSTSSPAEATLATTPPTSALKKTNALSAEEQSTISAASASGNAKPTLREVPLEYNVDACKFGLFSLQHISLHSLLASLYVVLVSPFDPFVADETDLSKCNALNSSLWELAHLRQHHYAAVAQMARIFEEELTPDEWDVTQFARLSDKELFDRELARPIQGTAPLAIFPPVHLFATLPKNTSLPPLSESVSVIMTVTGAATGASPTPGTKIDDCFSVFR